MDIIQIITLALIQGLTEFLPISSSAHLILLPTFTNWQDQGLAFDVAVHVGSLVAVLMYFRADLSSLLGNWLKSMRTFEQTPESRLVWGVGIATIPVGLAGLAIKGMGVEEMLRSPLVLAGATIVFGLLLWFADVTGKRERNEFSLTWKDISIIGLAQALALIPGTSRSGITITAGLLLGLNRKAAARFSFLLAIPTIILAGGMETISLVKSTEPVNWDGLWLAFALSALSAYICIHLFISLLDKIGMLPFVIYRLILGVVLLIWMV
jgi:undecaprenyl-diphosphatase